MMMEEKKYSSGNKQTRTPRSEIEKAFALSLGFGKDISLQFLSNALKPYKKLIYPRHLFEQIWAPIKNQDVTSIKQDLNSFKWNSNEESYSFRKR